MEKKIIGTANKTAKVMKEAEAQIKNVITHLQQGDSMDHEPGKSSVLNVLRATVNTLFHQRLALVFAIALYELPGKLALVVPKNKPKS